jgi:hypothetical protein
VLRRVRPETVRRIALGGRFGSLPPPACVLSALWD